MSDGDAEDAMYFKGVDDARKFWRERCDTKLARLKAERKNLQSRNLLSYCDGYIAGVEWCRKQGEVDRYIDPQSANDDDLLTPENSLP